MRIRTGISQYSPLLPPAVDPPLEIPDNLPRDTPQDDRERFSKTPIYDALTGVYVWWEEVFNAVVIANVHYSVPYIPSGTRRPTGRELYDYGNGKLVGNYWHTFFHDYANLAVVGMLRTLTFRSFEYQAVAIASRWAGRASVPLPPVEEQRRWEKDRLELLLKDRLEAARRDGTRFQDVGREYGDMFRYFQKLFDIAGLGTLKGKGRLPPVLSDELMWALEHLKKYPEKGMGREGGKADQSSAGTAESDGDDEWVVVDRSHENWLVTVS
ncbi:Thiol-specific monooxygenase [Apiospora phragmitis]|uniref:Thiol-specific monooxygenase n=1 Tax=Apiospora phragmitis TaxID=2905665 RepID=A0ABR1VGE3_9PEZI